jgi:hypothetical protein
MRSSTIGTSSFLSLLVGLPCGIQPFLPARHGDDVEVKPLAAPRQPGGIFGADFVQPDVDVGVHLGLPVFDVAVSSTSVAKKYGFFLVNADLQENAKALYLCGRKARLVGQFVQKALVRQPNSRSNVLHFVARLVDFDPKKICVGHRIFHLTFSSLVAVLATGRILPPC